MSVIITASRPRSWAALPSACAIRAKRWVLPLFYHAMRRGADNALAAAAIIVDAKDEAAAAFYQHHGFLSFGPGRTKLYLPIKDVRRLFAHSGDANPV